MDIHPKPCRYEGEHPPHLWAFQAPSNAVTVGACPGVIFEYHYNDEQITPPEWIKRFGKLSQ